MGRKAWLVGLIAIGLSTIWAAEAVAGNVRYSSGRLICKGVRCEYEVTGTSGGSHLTTGTCEPFEVQESFLFCFNPANNAINGSRNGQAFSTQFPFISGLDQGANATGKRKGRSAFNVVSNAAGISGVDTDGDGKISETECEADPTCHDLRQFCTNANWIPQDIVPITFCAALQVWECLSSLPGDCPCNPALTAGPGVCKDHDSNEANGITPMMDEDKLLYCEMPPPIDTYSFGEARVYSCRDAVVGECGIP